MQDAQENLTVSNLLNLVKEYETMIQTLTMQVEFYAGEQENLRNEISAIIAENKHLGEAMNELLNATTTSKTDEDDYMQKESELTDNLKRQLQLTLQEKDTVVQLWQNALKNIDHLEEELKLFEGRTHGYISKSEVVSLKKTYENQIGDLQTQLKENQVKLDNLKRDCSKNLDNKNEDLKKALDTQENTATLVKTLEGEVQHLQGKLKEIVEMRDELKLQLNSKDCYIEQLKVRDLEAKRKVTEAVQVVEAAFFEKDAALTRENEAKDEVLKISKTLCEVIDEATEKVKTEVETIKEQYSAKAENIQMQMEKLREELNAKNIEIEKYTKECKLLEEELERMKKGNLYIDESNTSKLLILEKNLESTFQKLLLSERKVLQVTAEKESINADLEQMGTYYENDVKRREVEKQVLKNEIQSLKKQLKMSNRNLIEIAGEVEKMNSKIKLLDTQLQSKLQAQNILYKQSYSKAMEEVQQRNKKAQDELQQHIEKQIQLRKKWQKAVVETVQKLRSRIKILKKNNKSLEAQLNEANKNIDRYKKNLISMCSIIKQASTNANKDTASAKE